MKRFAMWSGGKDSSASVVVCHQKGIHLDGVVMAEVMFDHKRGISGENQKHIEWVYNEGIPNIEKLGYKVIIVKDNSDYMTYFHSTITKSNNPNSIGKKRAFYLGGHCTGQRDLKLRPIKRFLKEQGECEQIIGIAIDEPERLVRLGKGKRSVLAEYGITETMTYPLCAYYGLLSPIYDGTKNRGGCWFCPNQSVKEFAKLKREYPHLWEELRTMAKTPNLVSDGFKYGQTFFEVERQVDCINNQINIFDYLKELGL